MSTLVRALAQQDERERNWLIRDAFDHPPLARTYCQKVEDTLEDHGHIVSIPDDAFWAIDYTFTWISKAFRDLGWKPLINSEDKEKWSNRDADLLIAFGTSLILIEAKGKLSHSNGQIEDKINYMEENFGRPCRGRIDVAGQFEIFFLLTSPRRPQKLKVYNGWNDELEKFIWMKLPDGRLRRACSEDLTSQD